MLSKIRQTCLLLMMLLFGALVSGCDLLNDLLSPRPDNPPPSSPLAEAEAIVRQKLPFIKNIRLVKLEPAKLLEVVAGGSPIDVPCAAQGGSLSNLRVNLAEFDLRSPESKLDSLNTYRLVADAGSPRLGVFSLTKEWVRSLMIDNKLGLCSIEPVAPLLRLNGTPEEFVQLVLKQGDSVAYNVADVQPGPDRSRITTPELKPVIFDGQGVERPLPFQPSDELGVEAQKHLDGAIGKSVLSMGYLVDQRMQTLVRSALLLAEGAVSGTQARIRSMIGYWHALWALTMGFLEPCESCGGHGRYNIIPQIGSIDFCGVPATDEYALNCQHTVQHINVAVLSPIPAFGGPGGGWGFIGTPAVSCFSPLGVSPCFLIRTAQNTEPAGVACGHSGSRVNGKTLLCANDTNHAAIYYGSGVSDIKMFSVLGEEIGHVFGCEPTGSPGESGHHTSAEVELYGTSGKSYMTGYFEPTFRPLYTSECDQRIQTMINNHIPPTEVPLR